ncbi:DNA polymerase III subunit beta, partial [Candidatus Beckwithbacteria bacterium RBG_13_42_9]
TVPIKNLAELIATFPADKITLEVKENWLNIEHKQGRVKFPATIADEFPVKELFPSQKKWVGELSFPAPSLLGGLKKVVFAAATDESRPVLSGVFFQRVDQGLQLVATDGYRLSVVNFPGKTDKLAQSLLVSAKALRELEKDVAGDKEVVCFVDPDGKQVFFKQDNLTLGSRLIEGEFPDFTKILPGQPTTTAVFAKDEMVQALRSAAIFARENSNIIRLEINKKAVKVAAGAAQVGEGSFDLRGVEVKGEDLKIAFNFRFLLEALAVFEDDQVIFNFSGGLAPVKLLSTKNSAFFHIIMPVKLQG